MLSHLPVNGGSNFPFEVVADLAGRWRAVPFESLPGRPSVWTSSDYQHGRLVQAVTNGCGCASGVATYTWYRFNGAMFVATRPPGPAPACTPSAVAAAKPLPGYPHWGLGLPWTRADLAARITVTRLRCSDGWALATATRDRRPVVVLFEQTGRHWLRTSLGRIGQLNANAIVYALPFALLKRLEVQLGFRHPPPFPCFCHEPPSDYRLPRPQATPAVVPIVPGAQFVMSFEAREHHTHWYATAVIAPSTSTSHTVTFSVFRWTGTEWSRRGYVEFHRLRIAPASLRYAGLSVYAAAYKHSRAPEFILWDPDAQRRLATINDSGGHWHPVKQTVSSRKTLPPLGLKAP